MVKFEDVLFWILIFAAIAVILWLLHGSPTDTGAITAIGTFLISSEILVWKKIFSIDKNFNSSILKIDKNTAVGFLKVKHDLDLMENRINNKLENIEKKLSKIK